MTREARSDRLQDRGPLPSQTSEMGSLPDTQVGRYEGHEQPAATPRKAKRKPQRAKQLGITDDAYQQLLDEQDGGCAICGNPPRTRRLSVDHNHRTGKVRGLLCFRCNRALPTYATSEWLRGAYVYVLRDEHPDLDVPDQWLEPIDQWAEAR